MKKLSVLMIAASMFAVSAFGLDLKEGRMRLVVEERSGRFSLYYLADVAKNRYVPLLYDQETRTTYPTISVDQKTFRLGDSTEFRVSVSKDADGSVRVEHRSSFCVVRQRFSFVASGGASMADGVAMDFEMENVSQKDSSIGLRMLLDTWLGEKSSAHFGAASFGAMNAETEFTGDYADSWVASQEGGFAADGASSTGAAQFNVLLRAPATRPDRVVAANWKRLNDAAWSFDVNPSRNFTLLPYSINDSAIALYYEPVVVRPGSTRTIAILLGRESGGYPGSVAADPQSLSASIVAVAIPLQTAPLDEMADIVAVRSVLDVINQALNAGATLSPEELAALESTLKRLEARKGKY